MDDSSSRATTTWKLAPTVTSLSTAVKGRKGGLDIPWTILAKVHNRNHLRYRQQGGGGKSKESENNGNSEHGHHHADDCDHSHCRMVMATTFITIEEITDDDDDDDNRRRGNEEDDGVLNLPEQQRKAVYISSLLINSDEAAEGRYANQQVLTTCRRPKYHNLDDDHSRRKYPSLEYLLSLGSDDEEE